MIDIKVPTVGESITEVTLIKWMKKDGDYVERDEVIAELESEKATFEVNAEKAGVLHTKAAEGDTINIGDVLAQIDETAQKPEVAPAAPIAATEVAAPQQATAPAAPQAVAAGKGLIDVKVPTVGESS
jgi:2-oxoglutarate dehydrogenase E2 component (dihydrolipoamide succinyltransferase)